MDPFETLTATQSPVDPFGTPPATPRPAAEVADFVNALWSRGGARGARHWSAEGATGGEHASAGGACSLADGGVAGVRAERATGAPKARRAERASAQAEHAGTRWSHRRSADNFTVQRSAPTGHLAKNIRFLLNCERSHRHSLVVVQKSFGKFEPSPKVTR
jgi:hypothetical protein